MIVTAETWDRDRWPNFAPAELQCRHTGRLAMKPDFLDLLQAMRTTCGFPFVISSGYRDPLHPVEARKSRPGTHAMGCAVDIVARSGATRDAILAAAYACGMTGKGIAANFVHVDCAGDDYHAARPVVWLYK